MEAVELKHLQIKSRISICRRDLKHTANKVSSIAQIVNLFPAPMTSLPIGACPCMHGVLLLFEMASKTGYSFGSDAPIFLLPENCIAHTRTSANHWRSSFKYGLTIFAPIFMRSTFLILDGSSAMLDFVGTRAYQDTVLHMASL